MTQAKDLAQQAEQYRLAGQFDQALPLFDRAIALKADYAWALAHRGVTKRRLLRYAEGLADLDQAIQLKPNYAWAMAYRAVVYGLLGRYETAVAAFEDVVELAPSYQYQWGNERGIPLVQLGRFAEAIAAFEDGLQARPNNPLSWYLIAVTKAQWQGVAAAQTEISHLGDLLTDEAATMPDPTFKTYALGGLAALHGDVETARAHLQTALRVDPDLNHEMVRYDWAYRSVA